MKKRKDKPAKSRPALDRGTKDRVIAILARNRSAFDTVKALLLAEHLAADDEGLRYAVFWRTLVDYTEDHDALPTQDLFTTEVQRRVDAGSVPIDRHEIEALADLIEYVFDGSEHVREMATSTEHAKWACATARDWLTELLARRVSAEIQRAGVAVADLPALLRESSAQADAIAAMAAEPVEDLYPDGWDVQERERLTRTGIVTFDQFLGGGAARPEVIAFMAPIGLCKTVVATQYAVEQVYAAAQAEATREYGKGKIPVFFLVSLEEPKRGLRERCLSYAARIHKDDLAVMKSLADLSSSPTPLKYEKALFADAIRAKTFRPQSDRAADWVRLANRHLKTIDLTGADRRYRQAGAGGVQEIAAIVRAELMHDPRLVPIGFAVDHASAMATRIVAATTGNRDDMRHVLRIIPQDLGLLLARPYDVPVLILHQLSGEANGRRPGAVILHTDSAECKSFAEFADFSIQVGPATEEMRLATACCSKHRRQPVRGTRVIQIRGELNMIVDQDATFVLDTARGMILPRSEYEKIAQGGPPRRRPGDDGGHASA